MNGIVLRYGSFYGPGTMFAGDSGYAELVRGGKMPVIGGGTGVWSFVHVADAAAATLAALDRAESGIWQITDNEPTPVSEWLPAFAEAIGAKPPRRIPKWLGRLAAGEAFTMLMTEARGASNRKAREELGLELKYPTWRNGFRDALT